MDSPYAIGRLTIQTEYTVRYEVLVALPPKPRLVKPLLPKFRLSPPSHPEIYFHGREVENPKNCTLLCYDYMTDQREDDIKMRPMAEEVNADENGVKPTCNPFAKPCSETEEKNTKETLTVPDYWHCCNCGTGPMRRVELGRSDAPGDFYVRETCIGHDCSHSRCEKCDDLPPCDLFAKLKSEVEEKKNKETLAVQNYWCCCECGTGPMGLERPVGLGDGDPPDDFYVEEKCIRQDCSHSKCGYCDVRPVEQCNAEVQTCPDMNIVNGFLPLEQTLQFCSPDTDSKELDSYRVGARDYMLGLSLSEVLGSESPSTPGLTISSAGSPDCGGGASEDEKLPVPKELDQQIIDKKSQCKIKLGDTWYRRWAKQNTKGGAIPYRLGGLST